MRTVFLAVALLSLSALPAAAQGYYGSPGYGASRYGGYDRYDFNGQADRPGDYRCDRYWDASRTDCGAAWRDQRPYGRGHRYGYARNYGYGYGYRYVHPAYGANVYPGAYGRPDLVYPSAGYGYAPGYGQDYGGRDPGRIDWCRRAYRSYDPGSGYYRAYSGRLIYCG